MEVCAKHNHRTIMSKKRDKKDDEPQEQAENETPREASAPTSGEEGAEPSAETPAEEQPADLSPEEDLLRKLDEISAEANAHKERYLRTVADLENYRKRAVREKEEARKQAISSLMEDLLPVLDNFQLGLKSAEMHDGGSAFAEGFRMVLRQMESALTNNGLVPVDPEGETFDPNYHECVAHLPHGTVAEGHVMEVQRVGYRYQERLLRPAAVVVSSGPEKQADDPSKESSDSGGEEN